MSKIKALDFAKSVDSSRESLKDILKNKGVNVAENQSLQNYVNSVAELPNAEQEVEYVPDPYFVAFDKYFETDPLLKKNGGEYESAVYAAILCLYDTSYVNFYLYSSNKAMIYTSDGQTIEITGKSGTQKITITWDKTKDGQTTLFDIPDKIKTGQNVRWVRLYSTYYDTVSLPCYPTDKTTEQAPIVYQLSYSKIASKLPKSASTGKATDSLNSCKYLQYITTFGDNVAYFGSVTDCPSLECINNFQPSNSDSYVDHLVSLKKVRNKIDYWTSYSTPSMFLSKPFISDNTNISIRDLGRITSLTCTKNIDEIYVNGNNYLIKSVNIQNIVTGRFYLWAFELLTLTTAENFSPTSIELLAPKLSKASIVQLFNNLKDLTNATARTITISANFFVQLTDEEKEIPINKNWTLSFK